MGTKRTKRDFHECPICGFPLKKHYKADRTYNEYWDFECGACIVLLENGKLEANDPCGNSQPLEDEISRLNATRR